MLSQDFSVSLFVQTFGAECLWRFLFQGGPGSVWFGYGLGVEWFERFRVLVPAVPLESRVFCVSEQRGTVPVPGLGA